VARVPAKMLTDAPTYVREGLKPAWLEELQNVDLRELPDVGYGAHNGAERGLTTSDTLLELLASPEIASKRIVWRRYDHQVGTNTVIGPGSDAAVIRIKDTTKALAMATDGNAAYAYLDPYAGGAIAVCEAARNVACTGAKPIALTNCLNFGNPEKPEGYFQLKEAIRGMADAARALGLPVISGNVSLYNESTGEAIWPTPVVGCVGLLEDVERAVPSGFQRDGDVVMLIGWQSHVGESGRGDGSNGASAAHPTVEAIEGLLNARRASLAGSEYLRETRGVVVGMPAINLIEAVKLQQFLLDCGTKGLLASAHDISGGGLATALAECCNAKERGMIGGPVQIARFDEALFGESQSRVVVSCDLANEAAVLAAAENAGVRALRLGVVGGERLTFGPIDVSVADLRAVYESGLPRALEGVTANV
jgi:phosphoribosylformylglycinamidine synthase